MGSKIPCGDGDISDDRIRELTRMLVAQREAQGVSKSELYSRTGITRVTQLRMENERYLPHLATLQRYARGLGMELRVSVTVLNDKVTRRPHLERAWSERRSEEVP